MSNKMLHNYKSYELFKMYNKYETSFIYEKNIKTKWYCWKYRYTKDERLLWGKIKSEYNDKDYDVWLCYLKPRKKNELVINKYNKDEKITITFD